MIKEKLNQLCTLDRMVKWLADIITDGATEIVKESNPSNELLALMADDISTIAEMSLDIINQIYDEVEAEELSKAHSESISRKEAN